MKVCWCWDELACEWPDKPQDSFHFTGLGGHVCAQLCQATQEAVTFHIFRVRELNQTQNDFVDES